VKKNGYNWYAFTQVITKLKHVSPFWTTLCVLLFAQLISFFKPC